MADLLTCTKCGTVYAKEFATACSNPNCQPTDEWSPPALEPIGSIVKDEEDEYLSMLPPLIIGGQQCLTVGELIEHLKTFPEDAPVVFSQFSDYSPLTKDEVKLHRKEDRTMVKRGGRVMEVYPVKQWGKEKPKFITVVTFPGN